ncbi:LppX_LprAFG lipoprotein [Haloechinothrix halophila]|uniref:Lipoprotein LprG n=1 Tax=Haloechinothrix halophila YIM 93223 TaxID=592678 RepID=W9DN19_9PSEU|nr:LppX_LprAFG lipoprotein [Haloechinothrix halophila]ETA66258.1 Protein of unknown function (DUF1396) [Haloechinothrix halophila YIM 93223]
MLRFVTALLAVVLVTAGCTSDESGQAADLPGAAGLLDTAAQTAAEITSTHFVVDVNGEVPGMAVENIDGDLTTEGNGVAAKGIAVITAFGSAAEANFVLADDVLYLDTGGGTYREIPAAQASMVYDFSAVLDPERGIAKLIGNLAEATTVAEEDVNGTATYKITGTATKDDIAGLVPGASSDVDVTLWVSKDEGNQPVKAEAVFPGGGGEGGTVTVTLSQVNEPVTVEPPQ